MGAKTVRHRGSWLPPQPGSNDHDAGTVLLHLYAAALYRRFQKHVVIPSLYIPLPSPFPELESFIDESIKTYDLELFHCLPTKTKDGVQLAIETVMTPASGIPSQPKKGGGEGMKKALEAYKSKFPDVKGILIGTRRTDPYCGMIFVWVGLRTMSLTVFQINLRSGARPIQAGPNSRE